MKIFIFLSAFLSANSGFAEFIVDDQPEKPTIIAEKGKPPMAIWKNGREATGMFRINDAVFVDIPATVYENSCTGFTGVKCNFRSGIRAHHIAMIWTKHEDAKRVGQILKWSFKNNNDPKDLLPGDFFFGPADHIRYPEAAKDSPKFDTMTCDDYRFLPSDPFMAPYNRIKRWETEIMDTNPETGMPENRSTGGALDVELFPDSTKNLLEVRVRGVFVGRNLMLQGDIVSWTMADKNKQICQIGLKPDFATAIAALQKYSTTLPNKFVPYVFSDDGLMPEIINNMKSFLENPNLFRVE
ncbi:MAG: hypothetical protein A4S09_04705 [Proteobacteria bacterium SG_bin7]|nr:MAG: hypothetical protein A4S09_04705 [Proteobacteria bacterium SG_bin7]